MAADDALATVDVPAMLADLVDRSMVIRDGPRYRLLETLREYARERLDASGEETELRRRHRDWYAALAARGAADWRAEGQRAVFDRLAAEHANPRAALEHCLGEPGQATAGSILAADLWLYWQARGHIAEGRRWLSDLLERRPEADAVRARSLWVAGHLALAQRDVEAAQALLEAADRALYRAKLDGRDRAVGVRLEPVAL